MEALKTNIIDLRKLLGLTQKAVAQRLGIAETTYQAYEQGRNEPSAEMIIRLADLFEVTTDYLLGHHEVTQQGGTGITPMERKLLQAFRQLSFDDQNRVVGIVQAFTI